MKKLKEKFFGESVSYKLRMYRMMLLVWACSLIINGIVCGVFLQQGVNIYIVPFSGAVVLLIVIWLTDKVNNLSALFFWFLIFANVIIFPVAFITSGGINSGNPLWILVGLLMTLLMLEGWEKYFVVLCVCFLDLLMYLACVMHPEFLVLLPNRMIAFTDNLTSLFTVCIMLGIVFRYQAKIYNEERKLSEKRQQEVEEISNSKSLFFANMSHEIRTPINTIIGLNEMTLRDAVSDEVVENSINIQNASKILLALINDILDLSKIESGKMEIVPVQYETSALFSDIVNIIWNRAVNKGLEFKIDISDDIPSMLYGDDVRIKQIMTNILTNAVKYTEQGSITLTITGEKLENNLIQLKLAVEDTGIGMKKENLDEMFTVFKRFDQKKTKRIEGTGLGLSISKQLVDLMGGDIKVDSIYGKGSCFTVNLEQQIIDSNPIGSMQHVSKRMMREKYDRSFEAPDAKILVVDDNEMNLMVVKKLLRDTKVQVDLVSSGKACLDATLNNNYHVILMDHLMPDMDGEETMKTLRARQEGYCQKTPVIALTANVMANAIKVYEDKGFDGYLAKPISGSMLEAALLKFLPGELIEYSAVDLDDEDNSAISSMAFHRKKRKVCIATGCISDIPKDWADDFGIKIFSYYIQTEEGRFIDINEVGTAELMEYLAKGKKAHPEHSTPEEYEAFFADCLVEAEQVIFISASQGIDTAYEKFYDAAHNFDNVTVLDFSQVTSGLGLIALQAARLANMGKGVAEITDELYKFKEKITTSFIVASVDNLYERKKLNKHIYEISKSLQLHPILTLAKNRYILCGFRIGDMNRSIKRYIWRCLHNKKKIDSRLIVVTHCGLNVNQLEMIKKEITRYIKFEEIRILSTSATVACSVGIGAFALTYVKK